MSSVKRKRNELLEHNYRRDSFSDRVCDDLSEVILQFLPLKDKFRFECLSKQFQRTVFQRQYELFINEISKLTKRQTFHLKTVLQKLPNIRFLSQDLCYFFLEDQEIDLIIEFCNNLVETDCDFSHISNEMRNKFMNKFGSKLESISSKSTDIQMIEKSFPNIKNIAYLNYNWTLDPWLKISELRLRRLKRMSTVFQEHNINVQTPQCFDIFQTLIENNKTLNHLELRISIKNESVFEFLFKQISKLKDLIHLHLDNDPGIGDQILSIGLKQISVKCQKLRSLKIEDFFVFYPSEKTHLITVFKDFKQLKRLHISFNFYPSLSRETAPDLYRSLNQSFEGLQHLTHLTLLFPSKWVIESILLKQIDKYLPKLQYLYIWGKFEATEDTADVLSRLSALESLQLKVTAEGKQSLRDSIESKVIKNCRKIKLIDLNPD